MSTATFETGSGGRTDHARSGDAAPGAVVALDSTLACDPAVAGAKASALARAMQAGLPVIVGQVLTTEAFAAHPGTDGAFPVDLELCAAWSVLSEGGTRPLVVRSSSTVEDGRTSSMAGMFTSVLDVGDWPAFRQAVDAVLESAKVVSLADAGARDRSRAAMAVLVQPQLAASVGGVMFGVDPVTGRTDHVVVSASAEGPAAVVGGAVDGSRYVLSGRRVVDGPADGPLTPPQLRQLAMLSRQAARVFGGPQDVEWAFGPDGRLWLLQSRPVTAISAPPKATGRVLGPGPVAETFPEPLTALEEDLWVAPLRAGLRAALALAGTTPKRRLASSPVVVTVAGRVAADLGLLGDEEPASVVRKLDPRPSLRRLVAAWRVGRLRAALPSLAADLLATVDDDLLAVGPVDTLSDRALLDLLSRSGQGLTALHGHEVLMGWLVSPTATATTAASVALGSLAAGRAEGLPDDDIVARHPGVLALVAPHIGPRVALPPSGPVPTPGTDNDAPDRAALLREALRLRARWLQELTARAAWELGERLHRRGVLGAPAEVRDLRLADLGQAVRTGTLPSLGPAGTTDAGAGALLPARFRLAPDGAVVAVAPSGRARGRASGPTGGGTGAGGGRGMGRVHDGDGAPDAGTVLVVRTLDPNLAPLLPRLGGLVAETGSFLSHLAILAREYGVPTVVGVPDALRRFPPGATVVIDGSTGEVGLVEQPRSGAA